MSDKTNAEKARLCALKFRQNHPDLVRETVVDVPEWSGTYGEVPVMDDGNVGLYRSLYRATMSVTTGNVLVYNHPDGYKDFSVILPNMSPGNDTFTDDEKLEAERFILNY